MRGRGQLQVQQGERAEERRHPVPVHEPRVQRERDRQRAAGRDRADQVSAAQPPGAGRRLDQPGSDQDRGEAEGRAGPAHQAERDYHDGDPAGGREPGRLRARQAAAGAQVAVHGAQATGAGRAAIAAGRAGCARRPGVRGAPWPAVLPRERVPHRGRVHVRGQPGAAVRERRARVRRRHARHRAQVLPAAVHRARAAAGRRVRARRVLSAGGQTAGHVRAHVDRDPRAVRAPGPPAARRAPLLRGPRAQRARRRGGRVPRVPRPVLLLPRGARRARGRAPRPGAPQALRRPRLGRGQLAQVLLRAGLPATVRGGQRVHTAHVHRATGRRPRDPLLRPHPGHVRDRRLGLSARTVGRAAERPRLVVRGHRRPGVVSLGPRAAVLRGPAQRVPDDRRARRTPSADRGRVALDRRRRRWCAPA